jgi:hypothetical protein
LDLFLFCLLDRPFLFYLILFFRSTIWLSFFWTVS